MKVKKETLDRLDQLSTAHLTHDGKEVNNPKPVFLQTGLSQPPNLHEQVRRLLAVELSKQAQAQNFETFEESDDFDVDDAFDDEPVSQYDVREMQEEFIFDKKNKEKKDETNDLMDSKMESGEDSEGDIGDDKDGGASV